MNHVFLCTVSNLEICQNLGRGDRLLDDLFITNDHNTIRGLLSAWEANDLGQLLSHETYKSPVIIYSKCDVASDGNTASAFAAYESQLATDVDFFLATLWLVKDHCSSIDFMLVARGADEVAFLRPHGSSRFCADGNIKQTQFSRDELKAARSLFWRFTEQGRQYNSGVTALRNKASNSLSRAFSHRYAANQTKDVAFKVASYCSALEALFLTDKGELTHQLAERVAFFLGSNPTERRSLFTQVKDAYSLRSSSVHGSGLKPTEEKIAGTAVECDKLLRRVLLKIVEDESLNNIFGDDKELTEFFLDKIIGPE